MHDSLLERTAWRALNSALASGSLHLSVSTDDGEQRFAGTYLRDGKRPVAATGDSLADVILELAGRPRTKRCGGPCGEIKPLSLFSRHRLMPDGHCRVCRQCETIRLRRHKAAKRRAV